MNRDTPHLEGSNASGGYNDNIPRNGFSKVANERCFASACFTADKDIGIVTLNSLNNCLVIRRNFDLG
jgi:hypothetical protein